VARALIVGCGCRGRALGARLAEDGWAVRGTARSDDALAQVEAAGIEPAPADPARPGTILELVGDVAVVCWLLGSARGTAEEVTALHGEVLEHLMLRLVDTPVRGFVYETAGPAPADVLARGEAIVDRASTTWRIPAATIRAAPADHAAWLEDATRSATGVLRPSD